MSKSPESDEGYGGAEPESELARDLLWTYLECRKRFMKQSLVRMSMSGYAGVPVQAFVTLLDRLGIDVNAFPGLAGHREAFFASSQARLERLQNSGAGYITGLSFFKKLFRERTGITVSTIHGVKGAEFDVVIAFGLLQGMVPHFSDVDSDTAASKLLYVLASRARKHLHLISETGRSRGRYGSYGSTEALARYAFDYSAY